MLPDPDQQIDLSVNGEPKAAALDTISAGTHLPTAAQEPAGSTSFAVPVGCEAELVEGYCRCTGSYWSSRQRDKELGRVLLRVQGSLRGVGQSWLPRQAHLSGGSYRALLG